MGLTIGKIANSISIVRIEFLISVSGGDLDYEGTGWLRSDKREFEELLLAAYFVISTLYIPSGMYELQLLNIASQDVDAVEYCRDHCWVV